MGRGMSAGAGRIAAAAAILAVGALAVPVGAEAACYSSTSSSTSFADAAGDGEAGLAPEILGVAAATGSSCGVGIEAVISGASEPGTLIDGESVGTYIDTDGNPATGSSTWDGADRVVIVIGRSGSDLGPSLGAWNGSSFSFENSPVLAPSGAAGFISDFDQLGVPGPTTLGIETISLYEGAADNYSDFAPEVDQPPFGFPVQFSTAPPPPPSADTPPAQRPISAPRDTRPSPRRCRVPRVRGLTRRAAVGRLRRARCRYRIVSSRRGRRPGRVVSTSPAAGRLTSRRVVVRVTRRHRARSSTIATLTRLERRMSVARAG